MVEPDFARNQEAILVFVQPSEMFLQVFLLPGEQPKRAHASKCTQNWTAADSTAKTVFPTESMRFGGNEHSMWPVQWLNDSCSSLWQCWSNLGCLDCYTALLLRMLRSKVRNIDTSIHLLFMRCHAQVQGYNNYFTSSDPNHDISKQPR